MRGFACLLALLALTPAFALAQGRVSGVVLDRMRGGALGGALVTVQGAESRSVTDSTGRFELAEVPVGERTIEVRSPFLDSLALPPLRLLTRITPAGSDVTIATPDFAAYALAVCGSRLSDTQGVMIGQATRADGEPATSLHVAAVWTEFALSGLDVESTLRATVDTTDAAGSYALCGVPRDAQYSVQAGDSALGTAELVVPFRDAPVRRRELRVGPTTGTVTLRGRLVAPDATPLTGRVELNHDSTTAMSTDSLGRFVLRNLPPRSVQLLARAVGHAPSVVDITPVAPETDIGAVTLTELPPALAARIVEGRLLSREEAEFEERRRGAVGAFFDSTFLASLPRVTVAALSGHAGLVRPGPTTGFGTVTGETMLLRRSVGSILGAHGGCFPRIYVDGMFIGRQAPRTDPRGRIIAPPAITPDLMAAFLREAKRIEAYQAAYAPQQFTDEDGCGSVVIWRR